MSKRNFQAWLDSFRESIAGYSYYADFPKIYANVEAIKVELNILNSLIGSRNIKSDFMNLANRYPEILSCIPILLAVRQNEILCQDEKESYRYKFSNAKDIINQKDTLEHYAYFMEQTGLFELLQNHNISNLIDYVTGVETGLDSNARKNRCSHLMEDLVEKFIRKAGFVRNKDYFKEMYISEIRNNWGIDLSAISNQGKTEKRFDFVIKTANKLYLIETSFYKSAGSKLNETARSYKTITLEAKDLPQVEFVWFTDGIGWRSAKHNLEETFDVLEHIYNIADMENGIMQELFV